MKSKWLAIMMVLALAASIFVALPARPASADTTGPNFPGTGADVTGVGTVTWSNPGNITANGNSFASASLNNSTTHYLQATNFGFAIPTLATIDGITVVIGRYGTTGFGNDVRDNIVRLVQGGTIVGSNYAATGTDWPSTEGTATYGSATDLWGTTWTAAQINAANFGVVLSARSPNSRTASVDYMQVTVAYTYGGEATYSTAGTYTWTVPTGVASVTVEVWGGGGKGGTRTTQYAGGGGGGGAYSKSTVSVTPGTGYTVVVGAGATTTSAGGDSYFVACSSGNVCAKGGNSVADNSYLGVTGGAASSGFGTTKYSGGRGADGVDSGTTYGGGGGSSAGTGADGNYTTQQTTPTRATAPTGGGDGGAGFGTGSTTGSGSPGSAPGGAGGGGKCFSGSGCSGTAAGGVGAAGRVIITWTSYTYTSVTNGNWSSAATWNLNAVPTSVDSAIIANGTTVTLDGNVTTSGSVTVNSGGTLDLGTHSLTTPNFDVANSGTLQQTRTVSDDSTVSFLTVSTTRYYGLDITNGAALGNTVVSISGDQKCSNWTGTPTVLRCYSMHSDHPDSATVVFHYQYGELNGLDPAKLWVFANHGSGWAKVMPDSYGRSACTSGMLNCSVTLDNASLSGTDYVLAGSSPTAVTLESMAAAAAPAGGQIDVTWQTAQETDNLGFNLWRGTARDDANPIKLNADIIASLAPGGGLGAAYTYPDSYQLVPGTTYFYWLEDVSQGGAVTRHEPVTVTYLGPTAVGLNAFGATSAAAVPALAAAGLALVAGAAVWARRRMLTR